MCASLLSARPEQVAPAKKSDAQLTLGARQLRVNQRISGAAVRSGNSPMDRIEAGLVGSSFADGSLTADDLAAWAGRAPLRLMREDPPRGSPYFTVLGTLIRSPTFFPRDRFIQ